MMDDAFVSKVLSRNGSGEVDVIALTDQNIVMMKNSKGINPSIVIEWANKTCLATLQILQCFCRWKSSLSIWCHVLDCAASK